MTFVRRSPGCWLLVVVALVGVRHAMAQAPSANPSSGTSVKPAALQRDFFDAIRAGDAPKVLSYIGKGGVNVGPKTEHVTQEQVEDEFAAHRELYCKLFDSGCIPSSINLENSARTCSYRELLTRSESVHTAASEITRNSVRQAVLVARIKNKQCPNQNLIDFVFNLDANGWKLFSIP
jgi:hypothetical protein